MPCPAWTTATLTTLLLKKGLRRIWMRGTRPLQAGQPRVVGRAFTLRFVPAREDLATPESWSSPRSTRAAIEAMPAGCIAVVDAMGCTDAGIFGDILSARIRKRGVAGLVTDGVVARRRRRAGHRTTRLVSGHRRAAVRGRADVRGLAGADRLRRGSRCSPDDLVVADGDGAVVIPSALVAEMGAAGPEQERLEAWIMAEVEGGAPLPGLYPPNDETRARYEASRVVHR